MHSRRQLLLGASLAAAAVCRSAPAADAAAPSIIISERRVRRYGPVMFVGDSTSSRLWRTMRRDLVAHGLGPFRVDLQPGRSVSRQVGWGPNGVDSVRAARRTGFDPPTFVIALGFPDLYEWEADRRPVTTVGAAEALVAPLLDEIGPRRTVVILNLFSTKPRGAEILNGALDRLVQRRDDLVVADWASVARKHPEWHLPDGYHYAPAGALARQQFIARTMVDAARRTAYQRSWHP